MKIAVDAAAGISTCLRRAFILRFVRQDNPADLSCSDGARRAKTENARQKRSRGGLAHLERVSEFDILDAVVSIE